MLLLQVQQPMILLGTSLGSAIAVHFAREHPECVRAMVMSGPQVYVVSCSSSHTQTKTCLKQQAHSGCSIPKISAVAAESGMQLNSCHGSILLCSRWSGCFFYVQDGLGMMQKFPRFVAGWGVEASHANLPLRSMSSHSVCTVKQSWRS